MFSSLSNKDLEDLYFKAVTLKLDKEFIILLKEEMARRGLKVEKVEGLV